MAKLYQYPSVTTPMTPVVASEQLTLDKWEPGSQPVPTSFKLATSLIPSLSFVETVAAPATPTYVGGMNCEPIAIQHFQYQSRVQPLQQIAAPETLTLDKWSPVWPQPTPPIKRLVTYGINVAIASERIYSDTVFQQQNNPYPVRLKLRDYGLWMKDTLTPAAAAATPIYVGGQNCEPIKLIHFQYQSRFAPLFPQPGAPDTTTMDKWFTAWPQPQKPKHRLVQYGVNAAIASERIFSDVLFQPTNLPVRPLQRMRDYGLFIKSTFTPAPETITLDKWAQPTQEPRQSKLDKWQRFQFPVYVIPVFPLPNAPETNLLSKWAQPTEVPTRRSVFNYAYLYATIDTTTGLPVISLTVKFRRTLGFKGVGRRQTMEFDE